MFVYIVTNKINGKKYVGQTSQSMNNRWKRHLSVRSGCLALHSAIVKYGPENFESKILVIVGTKWEMDLYERALIVLLDTKSPQGYNLTDGGDGVLGLKHSEQAISKISSAYEKQRGSLLKINIGNTYGVGHKVSDAHKQICRLAQLGKKMSPEAIENMKSAQRARRAREVKNE
jgi:group I intron endonuclease